MPRCSSHTGTGTWGPLPRGVRAGVPAFRRRWLAGRQAETEEICGPRLHQRPHPPKTFPQQRPGPSGHWEWQRADRVSWGPPRSVFTTAAEEPASWRKGATYPRSCGQQWPDSLGAKGGPETGLSPGHFPSRGHLCGGICPQARPYFSLPRPEHLLSPYCASGTVPH